MLQYFVAGTLFQVSVLNYFVAATLLQVLCCSYFVADLTVFLEAESRSGFAGTGRRPDALFIQVVDDDLGPVLL